MWGGGGAEESRAKDIAARLGREGTRLAAVAALGALGPTAGGHTGEMVAMALASRDARERSEALAALAKCGGGDLSQQLLPLLRDSAPGVRAAAAMALGRLGAVAAADDIAALLEDVAEERALPTPQLCHRGLSAMIARRVSRHRCDRWGAIECRFACSALSDAKLLAQSLTRSPAFEAGRRPLPTITPSGGQPHRTGAR